MSSLIPLLPARERRGYFRSQSVSLWRKREGIFEPNIVLYEVVRDLESESLLERDLLSGSSCLSP